MTLKYTPIVVAALSACLFLGFYFCYFNAQGAKLIKKEAAKDTIENIKLQLVTDQVKDPVDLQSCGAFANRLYVPDLKGKVYILEQGKLLAQPLLDIASVIAAKDRSAKINPNENILFGIAFHPAFTKTHKFYICYKAPNDQQGLNRMVVSEFRTSAANLSVADPSSERIVMEIHDKVLNDGTIAFGPDGFLYLNFADMDTVGGKLRAQDLNSLLGKVLRIDVNKIPYGIPASNPYTANKNERPEIWASGFRKLWRFSFDSKSQRMIGADVGDKKLEEVDIIKKGGNYGWPIVEGDSVHPGNYKSMTSNFIFPVTTYPRTVGVCTIGGFTYEGNALPMLRDKYIFGDMNGSIYALSRESNGKWKRQVIRIRNRPADPMMIFSFGHDEKGEIFVIARLTGKDGMKGEIYKLVKA